MLKQRLLTALVLIPLTLAILFFLPPLVFGLLTALLVIACAWEWTSLMQVNRLYGRLFYLFGIFIALIAIVFVPIPTIFIVSFLWWVVALILVVIYPHLTEWWKSPLVIALMGVFVLIPCWAAINILRHQSDGIYMVLFLFVLVWGADSVAYFVGKKWGNTKLLPHVSPGKSIQGVVGAIIFAVAFSIFAEWLAQVPKQIWIWGALLSVITVLFSVVGDLFESMLKRQAGLKDSSQLLPGHGGLLDRIDSLTAAAPTFVLGTIILGLYLE